MSGSQRTDAEFLEAFHDETLPVEEFTHGQHLRLAWLELERHDLDGAMDAVCNGIRALTVRAGQPEKYHETMTRCYVRIIQERRGDAPGDSFATFIAANEDLLTQGREALLRHYRAETLDSERARHTFVPPDVNTP